MIKLIDILKEIKVDQNYIKLYTTKVYNWGDGKILYINDKKFNLQAYVDIESNDMVSLEFVDNSTEESIMFQNQWISFFKKYKIPYEIKEIYPNLDVNNKLQHLIFPISILNIQD